MGSIDWINYIYRHSCPHGCCRHHCDPANAPREKVWISASRRENHKPRTSDSWKWINSHWNRIWHGAYNRLSTYRCWSATGHYKLNQVKEKRTKSFCEDEVK